MFALYTFPSFFKDFHSYAETYSFSSVLFILACIDWIFLHFIFFCHCLSDSLPLEIHKHLVFPLPSITFTANSQACNHFCKYIYLFQILYIIAISCSLPTLLKKTGLSQFFSKFFWQLYFKNINFLTKTKKCLLSWLLWIQNYQMTGKYKKVNPMKYRIQTYILVRTWSYI